MCMHHDNAAEVHLLAPLKFCSSTRAKLCQLHICASLALANFVCMTDSHLRQALLQHAPPDER